jgi:hypothetical protein
LFGRRAGFQFQPDGVEHGLSLGFSTKRVMRKSSSICMMPRLCAWSRDTGNGGNGDVRPALGVLGDDAPEIHPVKLVAAQNQQKIKIVIEEVQQVLPHRIRRALVPRAVRKSLFGRQNSTKPPEKWSNL